MENSTWLDRLIELNKDFLWPIRDRLTLHKIDLATLVQLIEWVTPDDLEILKWLSVDEIARIEREMWIMETQLEAADKTMRILDKTLKDNE